MRVRLTANIAGDMRLQCLRDKRDIRRAPEAAPALLVCSSEFEEMTTSKKNGPRCGFGKISTRNTFTRYARSFLRELGGIFEETKRERCVFLTGTLPGSTDDALAALAAYSGWAAKTVGNWIRDMAAAAEYFGVWEYQKRGALHMHICVRCPDVESATLLKRRWKARWIRVLESIARRSGVDVFARMNGSSWKDLKYLTRTDAQTVEKSVSAYLGKYLSKGSNKHRSRCQFPPVSWWFASRTLQVKARRARRVVELEHVPLADAINLMERIGSVLAEMAKHAYGYVSPYDMCVKGLIALMTPLRASALYDSIAAVLKALGGKRVMESKRDVKGVQAACEVFEILRGVA